jgi:hypothetical protein
MIQNTVLDGVAIILKGLSHKIFLFLMSGTFKSVGSFCIHMVFIK